MMTQRDSLKLEKYLFEITERTLEYFEVEYNKEDLADLVMLELLNKQVPNILQS